MTAAGWGVRSENSETAATNLKEVKIKVSVWFRLSLSYLCIVTTDSAAEDFTGGLQEEVIWRGGDPKHAVCSGEQCRDMLRKLTLRSFSLTFT